MNSNSASERSKRIGESVEDQNRENDQHVEDPALASSCGVNVRRDGSYKEFPRISNRPVLQIVMKADDGSDEDLNRIEMSCRDTGDAEARGGNLEGLRGAQGCQAVAGSPTGLKASPHASQGRPQSDGSGTPPDLQQNDELDEDAMLSREDDADPIASPGLSKQKS